jgi:hypothetical protein
MVDIDRMKSTQLTEQRQKAQMSASIEKELQVKKQRKEGMRIGSLSLLFSISLSLLNSLRENRTTKAARVANISKPYSFFFRSSSFIYYFFLLLLLPLLAC